MQKTSLEESRSRILNKLTWPAFQLFVSDLARHLVLSKISIRDLVHTKMSLILGSFETIWHGPNMFMDALNRTKVQGLFGMNQMSYGETGQDQMSGKHFRCSLCLGRKWRRSKMYLFLKWESNLKYSFYPQRPLLLAKTQGCPSPGASHVDSVTGSVPSQWAGSQRVHQGYLVYQPWKLSTRLLPGKLDWFEKEGKRTPQSMAFCDAFWALLLLGEITIKGLVGLPRYTMSL